MAQDVSSPLENCAHCRTPTQYRVGPGEGERFEVHPCCSGCAVGPNDCPFVLNPEKQQHNCRNCGGLFSGVAGTPCPMCGARPNADPPPEATPGVEPSGFVKNDADKNRLELIPVEPLLAVGRVFTQGAKKYADHNYLKGTRWSRYIGALLRHALAWASGQNNDPETGESHLAHVVCCAMMLLEIQRASVGTDDRLPKPQDKKD